ncbi:hypothetical protein GYMLUDRAFT_260032 [Collybiopsis luxurians FD-317 M1]|uniref:DRBM domain-containing protein n=1 Tax=Collybiopsis luxurians FD-317 M1 TaxID=944289 RepID=A0A0D0CJ54_9AGAR|nr:hypothetical protein GYMLUDRAFT_260032 [Collybiopsis luxurians FD-317 M1]
MITTNVPASNSSAPALPTIVGGKAYAQDLIPALYALQCSGLIELGKMALQLVTTDFIFASQPLLSEEGIEAKRTSILEDDTILMWLDLYPQEKERFLRQQRLDPRSDNRKALVSFFLSYIGAVYTNNGRATHPVLQNWVVKLITLPRVESVFDPTAKSLSNVSLSEQCAPPDYASGSSNTSRLPTPPSSPVQPPRLHVQPTHSDSSIYSSGSTSSNTSLSSPNICSPYPQPSHGSTTLAHPSTSVNPSSLTICSPLPPPNVPAQSSRLSLSNTPTSNVPPSSKITVQMVNEAAARNRYHISYPEEQVGPDHMPDWIVRCLIDGNERGRGIGKTKKDARQQAGCEAYIWMNRQ